MALGAAHPTGERWCGGRGEAKGSREAREQRAGSTHRICLRGHRKASSRGEGSCWGGVAFLPPEGWVSPQGWRPGWGHLGAAPRGSRPPARPRFLGWMQGPGCRPPALCRPLRLSQRLMGPRPCGRSHRKGKGVTDPSCSPPQHLHEARGEAPRKQQRLPPCSPPATLGPIPTQHWVWEPTPHPHAHRGRAPGASGNRRSGAGWGASRAVVPRLLQLRD